MQDKKLLITPQISMLNEIKFVKPHIHRLRPNLKKCSNAKK